MRRLHHHRRYSVCASTWFFFFFFRGGVGREEIFFFVFIHRSRRKRKSCFFFVFFWPVIDSGRVMGGERGCCVTGRQACHTACRPSCVLLRPYRSAAISILRLLGRRGSCTGVWRVCLKTRVSVRRERARGGARGGGSIALPFLLVQHTWYAAAPHTAARRYLCRSHSGADRVISHAPGGGVYLQPRPPRPAEVSISPGSQKNKRCGGGG